MPDNKTHIDYSFQDIERYLNNGMNAEEMHALEKAALNDPFLADAIEGFAALPGDTADKHINQINAALQGEPAKARVVSLTEKKIYWWRIAATVVLIAGVGLISLYIINNNSSVQDKDLALTNDLKENVKSNADIPDSSVSYKPDSTLIAENNIAIPEKKIRSPQPIVIKENKQENIPEINASQFSFSQDDSISIARRDLAYMPGLAVVDYKKTDSLKEVLHLEKALQGRTSGLYYNKANNQAVNFFNGQIADNNNQPIANAVILANKNQATVTDKDGFFKITSADSVLHVMVSSVGFNSINTSLNTENRNIINLTPASENLSEVVVTGYGSQRKAKNSFADSAYPVGGWQSFLQYMDTTLSRDKDSLETTSNLDLEGADYVVEFLIDANGNPYSFRIPKNMNPIIRTKIIEMIKDGPRWVPAQKNNRAKLKIPG